MIVKNTILDKAHIYEHKLVIKRIDQLSLHLVHVDENGHTFNNDEPEVITSGRQVGKERSLDHGSRQTNHLTNYRR